VSWRRLQRARVSLTGLVAALALSLAAVPPLASAGAIDAGASSIAQSARLNASRTGLQLPGVVRCSACKSFTLGATVSQAGSGAIGQGGVRCVARQRCSGRASHASASG
jgi:hypothetical protein